MIVRIGGHQKKGFVYLPTVGIRIKSFREDDATEGDIEVNVDSHPSFIAFHVQIRDLRNCSYAHYEWSYCSTIVGRKREISLESGSCLEVKHGKVREKIIWTIIWWWRLSTLHLNIITILDQQDNNHDVHCAHDDLTDRIKWSVSLRQRLLLSAFLDPTRKIEGGKKRRIDTSHDKILLPLWNSDSRNRIRRIEVIDL